jgi:RNA 2',3'-cyclic 3'-phosphodiesterase
VNATEKPLRLFVAASVPEEELARIDAATKDLRDRLIGGRWAPIENQHVTLKFLGRTAPAGLADVAAVIEGVATRHRPAELSVDGLGVFPSVRRARVLWAGLRDDAGLLKSIADELAREFVPLGYKSEKRGFTPHLTLARFRDPVPVEAARLELAEGAPFTVAKVDLYRSHLSPKGAKYEVLRSFELG